MKKYIFLILSASFIVLSFANAKAQTSKNKRGNGSSISVLNGAWQSTWRDSANHTSRMEYWLLHDGFFSNVGQDSTGAWRDTHVGTYEISGNVYKQKLLYSSHPERMGVTHWIDFRISGDTLYTSFFKKLINPKGEDVTSQMQPLEQKYVRFKKGSM